MYGSGTTNFTNICMTWNENFSVAHSFGTKEFMNIPITPRTNLLIDVKQKRAAENKSSEVGKNMFIAQRRMVGIVLRSE